MRPAVEACRLTVAGCTVRVVVDGDGPEESQRELAEAFWAGQRMLEAAMAAAFQTATQPPPPPPAPEQPPGLPPAGQPATPFWSSVPSSASAWLGLEAGAVFPAKARVPEPTADRARSCLPGGAAASPTEINRPRRWSKSPPHGPAGQGLELRTGAARQLGLQMRSHFSNRTKPPQQAQWPAPLRARCWAGVRGRRPDAVGVYGRWALEPPKLPWPTAGGARGSAEAAEGDETAIAFGFPSLEEARTFMQGAGLPIIDRRR